MTTNPTTIPEPTSPTAVVVAKLVASPKTGTQPPTITNEFGFEGKRWRTTGGDLTLFEYMRRDFGALGGWHPGMGDAQGCGFWRQPEKFTQTALIALHSWAAVHDHELHDMLERHEDLCLGMGPCDRSGVES